MNISVLAPVHLLLNLPPFTQSQTPLYELRIWEMQITGHESGHKSQIEHVSIF